MGLFSAGLQQPRKKRFAAVCDLFGTAVLAGYRLFLLLCFPQGLSFFTSFAGERVAPMLSIESYLDFFLMLVLPFGFIFNLPMAADRFSEYGAGGFAAAAKRTTVYDFGRIYSGGRDHANARCCYPNPAGCADDSAL